MWTEEKEEGGGHFLYAKRETAAPTSCRGSDLDTRGGELSSLGEGRIGSILDAMQTWDIFGAVTKSCATVRRTKPRSNGRLVASGEWVADGRQIFWTRRRISTFCGVLMITAG